MSASAGARAVEGGRSMLWPAAWLAAVLVAAKCVSVAPPDGASAGELTRWTTDVLVVSAADAAFAVGLGLAGQALLRLTAQGSRAETNVRRTLLSVFALSAFYAVASVAAFAFLRSPLTFAWLYCAGDLRNMASSVGAFLGPGLVAALVLVPAGCLLAALWCRRKWPAPRGARIAAVAALVVVVPWNVAARGAVNGRWGSRHDDRLLAESPHWTLVVSTARAAFGADVATLAGEFPETHLDDFAPASERPDRGAPTPDLARGPRNVLVLVLESVATQHLGLYGSRYPTTPRLEAEAAHALVFDSVYSHMTSTANSLAAMTLSRYPPGLSYREVTRETPDIAGTSIAETLRERGYRTAFISAGDNHYANQRAFLRAQGFEELLDWRDSGRELVTSWGVADEAMTDMVLRWLDAARGRPFLAVAWTQGTHHPYDLPPGRPQTDFFRGEEPVDAWDLGRYLNALHEADAQIGRLLDGLRARGLADDTLVVVTGDHGEAFGWPHPNYGHSYKLYEEDVHVPFVLWNPRLFPSPRRSGLVGAHVDLGPTILDVLGLPSPGDWIGRSLLGPAHSGRAYFYGARDPYTLGVREGRHKYILDVTNGREELYDLVADRDEQENLHATLPEVSARLRARVTAWLRASSR